ncbi:hypothetical protein F5Y10DRAFT_225244 [Nemania abortiva]|nr:hypothetical protein F5Y10DRAFT_225244 [Nemania abortiva]
MANMYFLHSSDATSLIRPPYPPPASKWDDPEYSYGRPKYFDEIAKFRRQKMEEAARYRPPPDSPGKPGTRRKPGETKSQRRRTNREKQAEVNRGYESASGPGSDEPRVCDTSLVNVRGWDSDLEAPEPDYAPLHERERRSTAACKGSRVW